MCRACNVAGHKASVCKSYTNQHTKGNPQQQKHVEIEDESDVLIQTVKALAFGQNFESGSDFGVYVCINGVHLRMELDTGAEVSIVPQTVWKQLGRPELQPAPRLRAYGGTYRDIMGQTEVDVEYRGQVQRLPLAILETDKAVSLFGQPWIRAFNAINLHAVSEVPGLQSLLKEYEDLFESHKIGTIRGQKAHLYFKENAQFRLHKARPLPFALKPRVETELERLVSIGVLTLVDKAEFATTPLVAVLKPNNSVRLCGDFKVSLNPQLSVQQYPLPTMADVLQTAAGGAHFSKLDLADAYLQVELDDDSRRYVVFTTHKGLFQINRLAFGLAAAPAIFQSIMEQILLPMPRAQPYLDDILLSGSTDEEHLSSLRNCFEQLRKAGIKLKRDKCKFFQKAVEHLGHVIDASGVRPSPRITEVILKAPPQTDIKSLESWLCTAQYYAQFIGGFSTITGPLNDIRKSGVEFKWTAYRQAAFVKLIQALANDLLLVHYNDKLPVALATDASQYGVGAVLFHVVDGKERPIA